MCRRVKKKKSQRFRAQPNNVKKTNCKYNNGDDLNTSDKVSEELKNQNNYYEKNRC